MSLPRVDTWSRLHSTLPAARTPGSVNWSLGKIAPLACLHKDGTSSTSHRGRISFYEMLPRRSTILLSTDCLVLIWENGPWILKSWSALACNRVDLDTRSLRTHFRHRTRTRSLHKKAPPHYSCCFPLTRGHSSINSPPRRTARLRQQRQPIKEIT